MDIFIYNGKTLNKTMYRYSSTGLLVEHGVVPNPDVIYNSSHYNSIFTSYVIRNHHHNFISLAFSHNLRPDKCFS